MDFLPDFALLGDNHADKDDFIPPMMPMPMQSPSATNPISSLPALQEYPPTPSLTRFPGALRLWLFVFLAPHTPGRKHCSQSRQKSHCLLSCSVSPCRWWLRTFPSTNLQKNRGTPFQPLYKIKTSNTWISFSPQHTFSLSFPLLPCIFASTFFRRLKNEKATSTKMWLLLNFLLWFLL